MASDSSFLRPTMFRVTSDGVKLVHIGWNNVTYIEG
jgi:hypothetical protein